MQTEKSAFKEMTIKQKIEHVWEYYKWLIFGIILAIAFVVYIIVKIVTPEPQTILNVTMVNANTYEQPEEDVFWRYLTEQGYNPEEQNIAVNTGLYIDRESADQATAASYQALTAMTLVGEIDLLIGNEGTIDMIGTNGGLVEMKDVLPAELLEAYEDSFYTAENPETGEQYICGIWLPQENPLTTDGYYGTQVLAAVPYTAVNQDLAAEFLIYLLENN